MVDRGDKYLRLLTGLIFLQTLSLSLCLLITFVRLVCYLVFLPETRWRPHSWLFPHLAVPIPTAPGSPYVLYRPAPRYRVHGPFPWICRTLTSTSLWIQGTRSIFALLMTERSSSFRSCRSACQPLPEPLRVWSERLEPISRRWESIYSSISTTGSW